MKKTLSFSLALLAGQTLSAQERPNIIVFLVDDMGLMDTSLPFLTDVSGKPVEYPLNEWYRTPNMERMARQGIRFSTFYAQSVSSPSRASILTGQNATRHGVTNWINSESNNRTPYGPQGWNWQGLSVADAPLPYVLQQAGYRTIHVGKAHFGCIGSEGEDPSRLGFDVNIAGSSIGEPGSYYGASGYGHLKGNKSRAVPGLQKYHGTDLFLTEALTLEAEEQIARAAKDRTPFFLYMSHYAVHTPLEPDPRFAARYRDSGKSPRAQAFATLIEGMDRSLGEIMDCLEEQGIAENTLILFLGDNGSDAPLGAEKEHTSSAPLRGKKGTEFEGGVRVPFIACWGKPDRNNRNQRRLPIRANAVQLQSGTVMDIYPTVLRAAGVPEPENHILDGRDLGRRLQGKKDGKSPETMLVHFPHRHRGSYFTTYRNGAWKLIYYYRPENPSEPEYRLYNLEEDPWEDRDLSGSERVKLAEMVREMRDRLEAEGALYPEDAEGRPLKPVVPES